MSGRRSAASLPPFIINASDGARPNKRGGRRSGVGRKIHTAVHTSQSPVRSRNQYELAEQKTQDVAAEVARSCTSAPGRGKVQPYLYRRWSAQQLQTRMRTEPVP